MSDIKEFKNFVSEKDYTGDAKKLLTLRDKLKLNLNQLAKKLGINVKILLNVNSGRDLPAHVQYKILKIFGYDFDAERFIYPDKDNLITISFERSSASAGSGIMLDDSPLIDNMTFDKNYLTSILPPNTNFDDIICITASGDSMKPTINDGDILFIDKSKRDNPNGIYVIIVNGELRVKRILKKLDGTLIIQSDNPLYPQETYEPEKSNFTITIKGKVIFNLSKGSI